VAERAGVARATLYQHFRSRLGLIDAMCETFDENPALVALRKEIDLGSADDALERTIAHVCSFWASEERVLVQLYGVVAVDPAAADLVDRQRNDRRGELARVARRLAKEGRLGDGLNEKRALTLLMLLTSFETFRELRHAGVSDRELPATLQETARTLLLR